ncbi:MAG: phage terminase small subunit P27 family [Clostridium sp.]|uniref:phage terminase small subunit P27 family n=1 Tax=Clostridium sp. TaxID=1506 RepID=UPI003F3D948B
MSRNKKPALFKQGKSESKAELKQRAEYEEKLKGKDDLFREIPPGLTERGAVYYVFLTTQLEESALLCNLDIPILKQTADTLDKMDMCDEILARDGILVEDKQPNGLIKWKEHPTVKTKATYSTAFRAFCSQLGMSPAARASLAGAAMERRMNEEDPVLKLLSGE